MPTSHSSKSWQTPRGARARSTLGTTVSRYFAIWSMRNRGLPASPRWQMPAATRRLSSLLRPTLLACPWKNWIKRGGLESGNWLSRPRRVRCPPELSKYLRPCSGLFPRAESPLSARSRPKGLQGRSSGQWKDGRRVFRTTIELDRSLSSLDGCAPLHPPHVDHAQPPPSDRRASPHLP